MSPYAAFNHRKEPEAEDSEDRMRGSRSEISPPMKIPLGQSSQNEQSHQRTLSHEAAGSQFSNGQPFRSEQPINQQSEMQEVVITPKVAVNQSFDRRSNNSIKEKLNKRMQERKARMNQNQNEIREIQSKLENLQRESKLKR